MVRRKTMMQRISSCGRVFIFWFYFRCLHFEPLLLHIHILRVLLSDCVANFEETVQWKSPSLCTKMLGNSGTVVWQGKFIFYYFVKLVRTTFQRQSEAICFVLCPYWNFHYFYSFFRINWHLIYTELFSPYCHLICWPK